MNRRAVALSGALAFGSAFLYLPIAMLVLHSFNASRISSAWGGFSLRWYAALLRDAEVIEAALLSLRIALCSAIAATVLGAAAGLALARMGRFRGRTLFTGMVAAPLVMPEVITGLSLLLLFVSLQGLEYRRFSLFPVFKARDALCLRPNIFGNISMRSGKGWP